jgi:hypothetical protein
MAEDLSSFGSLLLRMLAVGGVCACPCADLSPLIQTDKKTNNLTVEIAAMNVLRMSVPPTLGDSILTHTLLATYKMRLQDAWIS